MSECSKQVLISWRNLHRYQIHSYVRGSFDKYVTKQRHSVSFPNTENPKYTFCRKFNSPY